MKSFDLRLARFPSATDGNCGAEGLLGVGVVGGIFEIPPQGTTSGREWFGHWSTFFTFLVHIRIWYVMRVSVVTVSELISSHLLFPLSSPFTVSSNPDRLRLLRPVLLTRLNSVIGRVRLCQECAVVCPEEVLGLSRHYTWLRFKARAANLLGFLSPGGDLPCP